MFEKGEAVRIKNEFWNIRSEGDPGIIYGMCQHEGQEGVIECIYNGIEDCYELVNMPYIWHKQWLEPVNNIEIEESEFQRIFE